MPDFCGHLLLAELQIARVCVHSITLMLAENSNLSHRSIVRGL